VNAFDSTRGWETVRLSFLVQRPPHEPGFELERAEGPGRTVRYAIRRRAAGGGGPGPPPSLPTDPRGWGGGSRPRREG
jgi:hypothetical protein